MIRLLSGSALLALAVAVVWFAPSILFLAVAEGLLLLAVIEYVRIARASGLVVPAIPVAAATVLTCLAFSQDELATGMALPVDVVLMSALVALGGLAVATSRGGSDALGSAAAALLPAIYLGMPIGAMVAVRETHGPAVLFLLMLTIIVSDTAQYYAGRMFGRRPLAARISPKKTIEGAFGGFVMGGLLLAVAGHWWLPAMPAALRAALGLTVVALGIVGDLFESALKRGAGIKDSSSLIPGHGGVLDRIDALLFAAPVYYVVLKYV